VLLQVVEAQAGVDREAVEAPRILRVEPHVRVEILAGLNRRVQHRHLRRQAIGVGLVEVRVRRVPARIRAPRIEEADLDVVRAGHVRRRCRGVVLVGIVTQLCARRVPQQLRAGVVLARILVPAWRVARLIDAGLVDVVVALAVEREAGLEQQLRRDRRGPLRRAGGEGRRVPHHRRRRRIGEAGHRVAAEPQRAVHVGRELVARRHLPRHPDDRVVHLLVRDALLAPGGRHQTLPEERRRRRAPRHVERVGDRLVVVRAPERAEEPQLVLQDRPALLDVELVEVVDLVDRADAERAQVVGQVVALPLLGRLGVLHRAGEAVAAVLRHQVHRQAAGDRFRRAAGSLVDGFLDHRFVVVRHHRAVGHVAVGEQAVDGDDRARGADAVHGEVGLLHRARAADVGGGECDADNQLAEALNRLGARHRVEHVARQHLRLLVGLDVNHRRRARDRDRLLERADLQVGVDGGGEVRGQLEAFALDRRETLERERDDVDARPEVDDGVLALTVGCNRLGFFDQHRACHFDGDARKYCTGRVLDRTADRALRARQSGRHHADERHEQTTQNSPSRHQQLLGLSDGIAGRDRSKKRLYEGGNDVAQGKSGANRRSPRGKRKIYGSLNASSSPE
jgi:hypothetical protein